VSVRAAAVLVLIAFVLDRATKVLVMQTMAVGQSIEVIPGFFSLTHVLNRGAAFGLLADQGPWHDVFLVVVAIVATVVLGWLFWQLDASLRWQRAAAAAVMAGALGNLYDRVVYGSVVDFLDVFVGDWHWPAFNVADSCITVGVVVLVIASFRDADVPATTG